MKPTTGVRSPAGDAYVVATLFCAVSMLSGSAYLVIKLAVDQLAPEVVAFARAALGAAVLWPLAYRRGGLAGLSARRRQLAVLGCLEFALPFLLLSVGSQWIASSLSGVLMAAGPLFVALFAIRLDASEHVSRSELLGLLVGLLGVVCLLGITFSGRTHEIAGAAIVIAASCSFALGALYLKRHFAGASVLGVVAGAMTSGCAVLALPAALALPDRWPSGSTVLEVGVLGIVHAALNYVLFFALVQRAGAGRASVTSYVAPGVAVLLGILVLHEPAGAGLLAGSVLIIVGSWLSTGSALPARALARAARRPRRPPVADTCRLADRRPGALVLRGTPSGLRRWRGRRPVVRSPPAAAVLSASAASAYRPSGDAAMLSVQTLESAAMLIDAHDPNDVVKAFAAGAPFRAATLEELVNADNAFRRPVRPDDLGFLDYSTELPPERSNSLSALLGHRMLCNSYDTEVAFLPGRAGTISHRDARDFYATETRLIAEFARPVLERHLFSFLETASAGPAAAGDLVGAALAARDRAQHDALGAATLALADPGAALLFQILQWSLAVPAGATALGRAALGDDAGGPPVADAFAAAFADRRRRLPDFRAVLLECGLVETPRAYWQFYLGSTLAVANHLHRVCRDGARLFEAVGALLYELAVEPLRGAQRRALIQDVFGVEASCFDGEPSPVDEVTARLEAIVEPLRSRYGTEFEEGCRRGLRDRERLQQLAQDDLLAQVRWADRLGDYREIADAICRHLRDNAIDVDLDTFVESCEETSTTHVHDDHRLVVIEQGEMHFWNNVGPPIALGTGDALLVPQGRLHGSTVLSGQCTYHQPIIPDAMLADFV